MLLYKQICISKLMYYYISKKDKKAVVTFLNYGYADDNLKLDTEDEKERYQVQLYHYVASQINLAGLNVLEVGCGRGGGSSYVARYLKPKFLTAIDICGGAIKFCQQHYSIDNLLFSKGNSQKLNFSNNFFDAIINIESSHSYNNIDKFLKEVFRTLKPGGYFLFSDLRDANSLSGLKNKIQESGLKIIKEQIITHFVIRALDLDHERKINLIKNFVPKILRGIFKRFVAAKNSKTYKDLVRGKLEYFCFVLYKK